MKLRNIPRRLKRYISNSRTFCKEWKHAFRTGSAKDKLLTDRVQKAKRYRTKDAMVRAQCAREQALRILQEEYGPLVSAAPDAKPRSAGEIPKVIWWCWLQGLAAAPELVQTCLESVRKYMPGYEIRIITEKNWRDYIELPDYALDRLDNGLMSRAHFTDLMRLELLLRYGGIWIDATVLLTGDGLLKIIDRTQDLFMPAIVMNEYGKIAGNWLIAARPGNDLLRLTRELLCAWWKDHKLAIQYDIFHLFFTLAVNRYPEQWHAVIPYCRDDSVWLENEMNFPFSQRRYDAIRELTSIHKLSWKRKFDMSPGSWYDVLIRQKRY